MTSTDDNKPTPPRLDFADESVKPDPALFEETQADEPVFARHVLTSPLHISVARASKTNLWEDWNGITTPQILSTFEDEYRALHTHVGLSDVSPSVKYRITGRDAGAYLAHLLTDDVTMLAVNRHMQVVFCEERGFVVGDGVLFRLDEMEYRLVVQRPHLSWLLDSALGFRVKVEDVSASVAAICLAGPLAGLLLAAAGFDGVEDLKENASLWCQPGGMPVYVSRGPLPAAYDLWIDREDAGLLWSRLMQKGEPYGVTPVGRMALDLLRVEAGLLLEGRDYPGAFYAAGKGEELTPYDLGWGSKVDLAHGVFNGRAALRRIAGTPPRWTILRLEFKGLRDAIYHRLTTEKTFVGSITSAGFSPLRGRHVALARVLTAHANPLNLQVAGEVGSSPEPVLVPVREATDFLPTTV